MRLYPHSRDRGQSLWCSKGHLQCKKCAALILDQDAVCLDCHELRPGPGWPTRQKYEYPLLGHRLQERYLITGFLGSGSHAQVYRVWDNEKQKTLALKVVDMEYLPRSSFEHIKVRLNREIEALSKLNNPHIVSLYDVLQMSTRTIGMVMDFIDGEPLSEVIRKDERLEWPRALRLARQMALAIEPLHDMGKVHRDIKPENLMVSSLAPQVEFMHLLDFGLVSGDHRISTGFIGTPLHASPEMCAGELDVDPRSDLYSLGSVLFHMLSGKPPIDGNTAFEVIYKKATYDAPGLSRFVNVPERLGAFVAQLLTRNKFDRPATTTHFIERVDELLDELNCSRYGNASGTSFFMQPQEQADNDIEDVIVADVDFESVSIVGQCLLGTTMKMRSAASAQKLMELCNRRKPDLVLLSVELPDARELKIYKMLRQTTQARIVILVPEESPDKLFDAMRIANVDFLIKPLNRELLLAHLNLETPVSPSNAKRRTHSSSILVERSVGGF